MSKNICYSLVAFLFISQSIVLNSSNAPGQDQAQRNEVALKFARLNTQAIQQISQADVWISSKSDKSKSGQQYHWMKKGDQERCDYASTFTMPVSPPKTMQTQGVVHYDFLQRKISFFSRGRQSETTLSNEVRPPDAILPKTVPWPRDYTAWTCPFARRLHEGDVQVFLGFNVSFNALDWPRTLEELVIASERIEVTETDDTVTLDIAHPGVNGEYKGNTVRVELAKNANYLCKKVDIHAQEKTIEESWYMTYQIEKFTKIGDVDFPVLCNAISGTFDSNGGRVPFKTRTFMVDVDRLQINQPLDGDLFKFPENCLANDIPVPVTPGNPGLPKESDVLLFGANGKIERRIKAGEEFEAFLAEKLAEMAVQPGTGESGDSPDKTTLIGNEPNTSSWSGKRYAMILALIVLACVIGFAGHRYLLKPRGKPA